MPQGEERRRYPRVKNKDIAIQLSADGVDTITQSLDVSASGIYCKVDRYMPVMTRLQMALTLPGKKKGSPAKTLKLEGVVVREHPVKKEGKVQYYDVAIFFNALMPKERRLLEEHIGKRSDS